jgi:hypothetical protein
MLPTTLMTHQRQVCSNCCSCCLLYVLLPLHGCFNHCALNRALGGCCC